VGCTWEWDLRGGGYEKDREGGMGMAEHREWECALWGGGMGMAEHGMAAYPLPS
jgi:hypothetical protein